MASGGASFLESYLPYLLRKADQTLSAPFYLVLSQHSVSRSEWRVLAVLAEVEELSIVELGIEALSPQPTVTHAVSRLEKRGLVTRTVGASDRRQRFVSITEAGIETTEALIVEAHQLSAKALADTGDLSTLIGELERLTLNLNINLQSDDDTHEK